MRILNISAQKPDSTGSGTYLAALVASQIAAGHEAAVLCGAAPGDTQGELDPAARVFAVPFETSELPFCICGMSDVMPYPSTRYCDLTPTMAASFERAFGAAIDRAIAVFKPDAIICHHLYLLCALVRERVRGIPVCGVCHSTDIRQMLTHGLAHERIVAAVRCLDAVFSLHAEQADMIRRVYGVDPLRVHVIGTGYDHRVFCRDGQMTKVPGSLVFVGKVCVKKGVESLVHAMGRFGEDSDAARGVRPSRLVLVGGHGDADEYERIARASGDSPVPVKFAGRLSRDELVRAYREAEVFVLPSFYEGLPLVPIEAMACGCKVVMTELPGVRPWMEAALPGAPVAWVTPPTMVDVDTPDSRDLPRFEHDLAQAIQDALDAPAPCFDTSGVSWDACSERILETVQRLLEQKGGIDG